ncbi:MAG: metallophosphoesterase [Lactobacillus sp.]|jgi:putative phosphoesterase|nr:metallophosphoesterase [Lactobacillus sp.]MCI2033149.1 metallophosphoesterase [Lactobacillus sp.]
MKLVVVSDAHGDAAILQTILTQQPDADGYFYCGDSELAASDPLFKTYRAVSGNMDIDPDFPLTVTASLSGVRVWMTHGHRFNVNFTLAPLLAAGKDAQADIILFGHTHQLGVEQVEAQLVLNPGSISQPRGRYAGLGGTYAVITVTPTQFTVQYLTRAGQPVPELAFHFQR